MRSYTYQAAFVVALALSGCSNDPRDGRHPDKPPPDTDADTTDSPPDSPTLPSDNDDNAVHELMAQDAALAVIHGVEEDQIFGARGALADLTGDGVDDLAVYAATRDYDETFVFAGPIVGEIGSDQAIARVPFGMLGMGTGDFDGDGQQDLAVLSGPIMEDFEFQLYFGPIAGPLLKPDAIVEPEHKGASGYVCDANLDGIDDLVFTHVADTVSIALGPISTGQWGEEAIDVVFEGELAALTPRPSRWLLCGRDLTGDGSADLVLVDDIIGNNLWLLEDPVWDGWQPIADVGQPMNILNDGGALDLVGDLDGDGQPDLYVEEGWNGQLLTGPISATSEPYATFDWGEYWSSARDVGDLDGDGHDDLVVGMAQNLGVNGAVFLFNGPLGSGTYEPTDADLTLYGSEDAQLGYHMFTGSEPGVWGVTAALANGDHWAEGHVYLYSGWPAP